MIRPRSLAILAALILAGCGAQPTAVNPPPSPTPAETPFAYDEDEYAAEQREEARMMEEDRDYNDAEARAMIEAALPSASPSASPSAIP